MSKLSKVFYPGSKATIATLLLSSVALVGGGAASLAVGAKARGDLNKNPKGNQALPFLMLLGVLLLMVGLLLGLYGVINISILKQDNPCLETKHEPYGGKIKRIFFVWRGCFKKLKMENQNHVENQNQIHDENQDIGKEAKRVISAIKKAETLHFLAQVVVNNWDEFMSIVTNVGDAYPEKFIMLAATVDVWLYVATITKSRETLGKGDNNFISTSINAIDATDGLDTPPPLSFVPPTFGLPDNFVSTNWLAASLLNIPPPLTIVPSIFGSPGNQHLRWTRVDYPSKFDPLKAIDVVLADGAVHLRKTGAIPEEEEEYEYGFDDIVPFFP